MPDGSNGLSPAELNLTEKDLGVKPSETTVSKEIIDKLKAIDSSITERHVHSKFKGDVVLHGETLARGRQRILDEMLPADKDIGSYLEPQFRELNDLVRNGLHNSNAKPIEKQLARGHVFAVLDDEKNPELGTMQIIYPVEGVDYGNRPFLTLDVYLKMPRKQLGDLVKIIAKNPDALEEFYQISTNGLDSSVERRKATQVLGVHLKNFMADVDFSYAASAQINKLPINRGFTVFQYSKPQGQVEVGAGRPVEPPVVETPKQVPMPQVTPEPVPISVSQVETKRVFPPSVQNTRSSRLLRGLEGGPFEGLAKRFLKPKGT